MTRLIFLTFYGNERWRADDAGRGGRAEGETPTRGTPPTSPTATRRDGVVRRRRSRHRQATTARVAPIMILPILVLAALAAIGGLLNLPFKSMEWLDDWLEPSFRGVPDVDPDHLHRRVRRSKCSRSRSRSPASSSRTRSTARASTHADADPLDAKLGPLAPVLGHAYYYDDGSPASSVAPAARSPAGSTVWSTRRSSTARSTASARSSAPARRAAQRPGRPRAAVRARHRVRRRRVLLLYVVIRVGR